VGWEEGVVLEDECPAGSAGLNDGLEDPYVREGATDDGAGLSR
jgi:hypothetical protein